MLPSIQFRKVAVPFFSGEKETFATVLVAALIKLYGLQVLDWDGATIQMQLKDDLEVDPPRQVYDQFMALINALHTDMIYRDVPLFDETISALNRQGVGTQQDIPSVDEVAWAVYEIRMNDPDPVSRDPKNPWSRDIRKYVRLVLDDEGLQLAPEVLSFAGSKHIAPESVDDPAYYAGTWNSQQARADEVDQIVNEKAQTLIQHLITLGVSFETSDSRTDVSDRDNQALSA